MVETQYDNDETTIIHPIQIPPSTVKNTDLVETVQEPVDIPHVSFGGYQRQAVDDMVAEWHTKEQQYQAKTRELTAQLAATRQTMSRTETRLQEALKERDRARHDADNGLEALGRQQQQFVNSVRSDAEHIRENARQQAQSILTDANKQAQTIIVDAKQQADTMLASASHTAQSVKDTAQANAAKIEEENKQRVADAQTQAQQILDKAQQEQKQLREQSAREVAVAQQQVAEANQQHELILARLKELCNELNKII